MLTPLEINKKEFGKSFRGYEQEDVDTFLDQIVIDYEKLYRDNQDLREKLEQLDGTIKRYKELEEVLKNTLIMAQKNAKELSANAKNESNLILDKAKAESVEIIKDAEKTAEGIISDAEKKVQDTLEHYKDIQKQVQVFKMKFRSFLQAQLEILDEKEPSLSDSPDLADSDHWLESEIKIGED
ncbi:MAG TPA: DivIVA domain-containing protein [Clostridia bacterium]|nr:DivIVA domain-containing protein [Clostridia bacterium]